MLHGMGLGLGESMHEIETLVDKKLVQVSLSELYLFVYSNFTSNGKLKLKTNKAQYELKRFLEISQSPIIDYKYPHSIQKSLEKCHHYH